MFLSACFAGSAWILLCVVVAAQQPDRARTEALAARAGERLEALQREADRLASEERTVLGDLRKLEIERQLRAEELKQTDAEIAKVNADLEATAARMTALQQSELASRPELRARIVELYKLGRARYLRVLLSTPDLRRFGEASRTVAVLAKLDRDRVASHEQTLAALASTRRTLEERARQLAALRVTGERAQAAAERAAEARNALVRDIDKKRDVNAQLAGDLQAAQQRLQAALAGSGFGTAGSRFGGAGSGSTAADGGASSAPSANAEPGTRYPEPVALPLKPFKGDLDWPADGSARGRFGRGARGNGIEIDTEEGATAHAIHDGVVVFAGTFQGFGNLVIVDHGAQAFSLYGDLVELAVKKGARVEKGQPVGAAGATPSGVPGLYFELRIDGQPVDPLQWLRKR